MNKTSTPVELHAQLASIMEVLANAAVAEICELVDNGYAVLHLVISRGQKENESLRRKLRLMELKVARVSALRAAGVGSSVFASSRARASHIGHELRRHQGGECFGPRNRWWSQWLHHDHSGGEWTPQTRTRVDAPMLGVCWRD